MEIFHFEENEKRFKALSKLMLFAGWVFLGMGVLILYMAFSKGLSMADEGVWIIVASVSSFALGFLCLTKKLLPPIVTQVALDGDLIKIIRSTSEIEFTRAELIKVAVYPEDNPKHLGLLLGDKVYSMPYQPALFYELSGKISST